MESTRNWKVTHGGGRIVWKEHDCPVESTVNTLATPASAWLSLGFSAIAAGTSIYNAFQLAEQKQSLDRIAEELKIQNRKLDYVLWGIVQIKNLTNQVLANQKEIQDLLFVKAFFNDARLYFEKEALRKGTVTSRSIDILVGDTQQTLDQIGKTPKKDAPIPNWMIEEATPVFAFLNVLNLHLVEVHNILTGYDPKTVRRYIPVDGEPLYLNESPGEPVKNQIDALQRVHASYKVAKTASLPRLQWLYAFSWEARMASFAISTSSTLSGAETKEFILPKLGSESERGLVEFTKI